ncbi:MAG: hypothetical protein GY834_02315 [Bacteroidetes bacterium]|nr:hypothetical protein [Bacteroidota bacterium]
MADDSELDYIRTFLLRIHTVTTPKHITEARAIKLINDTSKMIVGAPEIMGTYLDIITKRYKVDVYEASEPLLMTAINNIVDGINKLNIREDITSFTRPGILLNGRFISGTIAKESGRTKVWKQQITLEFEWCTS